MRVDQYGRELETGLPGRQGRLLLAYLLLNRDRACPRAELIDLLWPERPPAAADAALSALLSKLRRAVGAGVIAGRSELRFVAGSPVSVDVERAADAAAAATAAVHAGDWAAAQARAGEALEVDLSSFLPGTDVRWAQDRRRELEGLRLQALEAHAQASLRRGGAAAAERGARAVIAAAPFRESAHRLLMEVHEAAGNPAEALRAFEDLRLLLREELGTAPSMATMAIHGRLLRGEPPPAPPVAQAGPPPLTGWPAPLAAALDRHGLVGRSEEMAVLDECWRQAADGERRLVLLEGDAGIGKTRAAAELARRARDDGAVVVYGRCEEQALASFQPLVEMVRGWSGGASLEWLREPLGVRARELGILLPELGPPPERATTVLPGTGADPERLRFFDAVAALLGQIGARGQLVVLLDDLQWADRPTLQLLRHVLRSPGPRRMLLLATCRDSEVDDDHPLQALLGDLRRDGMLERVPLPGLAEAEVRQLVEALGVRPSQDFVAALHAETEGNPFFIEEVVRHLGTGGDAVALDRAGVPEGVREVISRRLRRLGDEARAALQVAAVIGREFDFDLLEAVAPLEGDALVGILDAAVEARVLRESGRVGHYAFGHALLQATLYDGLSALRRARLHGRVGEAVAVLRAGDLDPYLPALAHHFAQAAPAGQPERAIDFALAAARRADRLLAWEEAAEHYRAALRTLEEAGALDERVRAELLLALGESEDRAGSEEAARETFRSAAACARELGDATLLGRAALGYAGRWSIFGRVDEERSALLEEALAELGEDPQMRARLLARLALELYYGGDPQRRLELSGQALELARLAGDPHTLAVCLDARHYALWRPENVEERLEVAAELQRVADATGDPELELEAAGWTVVDMLELGDVAGADVRIAAAVRLAEALQRPLWLWWTALFRCARAQMDGRFDDAERLAGEALAIGQRGQGENAVNAFAQAMFNIRREQGRLVEVAPAVARFVDMYPALPAWRVALGLLHLELGRPEAARTELDHIAAGGFDALPRDANWLIAMTLLAELSAAVGDPLRAEELYVLLAPFANRNVVVGRAASCNGSASRPLGQLAAAIGDWDRAEGHFADALAMHERMGARPWTVRTQLAHAEMLLARRRRGDLARARRILATAGASASALGMVPVAVRAAELRAGAPRRHKVPAGA
jgi:DNA-binding SARP family transcriptional activator/tetratricopeptide (TPR) repeat protein